MTLRHLLRTWTKDTAAAATSVVRHPIGSAAMAAGLVKGTAEVGAGLVHDLVRGVPRVDQAAQQAGMPTQREEAAPENGEPVSPTGSGPREPEVVLKPVLGIDELPEPIVIEADDETEVGGTFHNEPKAASRDAEHGDGPPDREELEADLVELSFDTDEDAPVWTSETPAPGPDEGAPVLDEGIAHAVRSESEILRKAAEQQPE